ncbi:MAG: fasciclin domain-containing protein [Winogradskyella sp.]|nr:fasciclin domain-containing protein [Winogradskyella sp.]
MIDKSLKLKKMKIISKTLRLLPIFILALGLVSCDSDDNNDGPTAQSTTIVDLAASDPNLSVLVEALVRADNAGANLVTTLSGPGPFTVLAPTNEAFANFLATNNFNSLVEVPTELLTQVLLNHVIAGNIASSNLFAAGSGYTNTNAVGPDSAFLSIYYYTDTTVTFNGVSDVITADVEATNGTVHVVDAVIVLPTVVDFALANPALSNLVAALQLADSQEPSPSLIPTLQSDGPFTVFAPTNDAFADLLVELDPSGNTELGDLDPATVEAVLGVHVVADNVRSSELNTGAVPTLGGDINLDASTLILTDANNRESQILATAGLVDIQGINGVVHVIGRVLLPAQN